MSEKAEVLHRHVSPDGELVWRVERETELGGRVTVSMGFEGLPWHLHPDEFERRSRTDEAISADVTEALLGDKLIVMTARDGDFIQHSLLDDLETELAMKSNEEMWTLRFWSGRAVSVEELIDGKARYLPVLSA